MAVFAILAASTVPSDGPPDGASVRAPFSGAQREPALAACPSVASWSPIPLWRAAARNASATPVFSRTV